jgi:flagellar assembly protein FliH
MLSLPDLTAAEKHDTAPQPMPLAELAPQRGGPRPSPRPALFEVAAQSTAVDERTVAERAAAQAAGYAAGWAHGLRAARATAEAEAEALRDAAEREAVARRARYDQAFAALDAAAARLERIAVPTAETITDRVLEAAFAIAEALVGHDVRTDPDRAQHALARVLALVPGQEQVTVRLCPADLSALTTEGSSPQTDRPVRLVADATLQPGDAVAVSGATEIDARLVAGLARVRQSLGLPPGSDGGDR